MFVRWKRKVLKNQKETTLCAVLCQAYRENGKPKQKVIKYLASIRETSIDEITRNQFWHEVNEKLKGMDIGPEEMEKIIAKLSTVVPLV
jgi:signal recognition particle GTPase